MDIIHVSFELKNLGDTIVDINGVPIGMNAQVLAGTIPGLFSLETDSNGDYKLCSSQILGQSLYITANDGISNYIVKPQPFEPVYCLDGHPTTVPVFKPKTK